MCLCEPRDMVLGTQRLREYMGDVDQSTLPLVTGYGGLRLGAHSLFFSGRSKLCVPCSTSLATGWGGEDANMEAVTLEFLPDERTRGRRVAERTRKGECTVGHALRGHEVGRGGHWRK